MLKLVSKLSPTKYPCLQTYEEIFKYVKFAPGVDPYAIDPVTLGRHAAMCKFLGVIDTITSGTRSLAKQAKLYIADGGRQLANGEWTGGSGYVAKPGKSYHNHGLAIDCSHPKVKLVDKTAAFKDQKTLAKFGLCKPMTKGNGQTVLEDWHIQPIETINLTLDQRKALAPSGLEKLDQPEQTIVTLRKGDTGETVKLLQTKLNRAGFKCAVDGDFGPSTEKLVKEFQLKKGLGADGIVGKATWSKLG